MGEPFFCQASVAATPLGSVLREARQTHAFRLRQGSDDVPAGRQAHQPVQLLARSLQVVIDQNGIELR